jgi:AAA15 family ATPase/GTPase
MITQCCIKNYKCFEDFCVSDLKRLNLISGKNNVGKSCLLEAIFLSEDYGNAAAITRHLTSRGLAYFDNSTEVSSRSAFYQFDTNRTIEIILEINNRQRISKISLGDASKHFKERPKDSQDSNGYTDKIMSSKCLSFKVLLEDELIHNSHILLNGNKIQHQIDIDKGRHNRWYFIKDGKINQRELAEFFSVLSSQGKEDKLIAVMKNIEPRLEAIKLLSEAGHPILHCKLRDMQKTMPVFFAGDGFIKLLSLCLIILSTPQMVLFVDEIENGLHYSVLPDFWKIITEIIVENNCQLFATTHSYEFIQAAAQNTNKYKDEFNFMRLERNKTGQIIPRQSTCDMLLSAIESDWEVR